MTWPFRFRLADALERAQALNEQLRVDLVRERDRYDMLAHEMIAMRRQGYEAVTPAPAPPTPPDPLPEEVDRTISRLAGNDKFLTAQLAAFAVQRLELVPPEQVADELEKGANLEELLTG